jgi:drug/metabolite transporter (DMT)-like permease
LGATDIGKLLASDWPRVNLPWRTNELFSPVGALIIAVLAVSTSAILVRWSGAPSLVKAFYRVLFTTLLLAPLAFTRYGTALRSLSRRDLLVASGSGVALALHFAAWFESLEWTSVAASVTLVQSQPVFVVLGATILLDERVGRSKAIGIGIALIGMVLMALTDSGATGPRPLYGNTLAVIGAVMVAIYYLAGRSLRQRVPLVPYVVVVYAVCAVTLFALVLIETASTGRQLGPTLFDYPATEWLLFLGLAIGPGILGHTVFNWALGHLEASIVSVSLLGEPIGSTLLAVILLAEVPGALTLVGGAVVLGGIYITTRARTRSRGATEDAPQPDPVTD